MPKYHMVMSEEFFGPVEHGAFDHWIGEVIPVRGPDRRVVGEATVISVDHRDDGSVSVVVSSTIDMDFHSAESIADMLRGRASMSLKIQEPEPEMPLLDALLGGHWQWDKPTPPVRIPHQPMRDDDVARWLKAKRDENRPQGFFWTAIDHLLDEYRARADYGFTLDHDMSELEGRW